MMRRLLSWPLGWVVTSGYIRHRHHEMPDRVTFVAGMGWQSWRYCCERARNGHGCDCEVAA